MSNLIIISLMFATLAIVVIGVFCMIKGGDVSKKYSNRLMRMRVTFQAITIILLYLLAQN
jgi:uncharacterized protein HemY